MALFRGLSCRLCLLVVAACQQAHAEDDEVGEVLDRFLSAQQIGVQESLGNWLESYALSERQVKQLIAAAQAADSEDRTNLLWHAVRCTRSKAGREYLMRELVEGTDETTKVRFVQSLTNLATFDVPLLTALYQSGQAARQRLGAAVLPDKFPRAADPNILDEIVKLATRGELVAQLSPRPEFTAERPDVIGMVNPRRTQQARQAKAELLVWLAKNAASEEHRLAVIEPALEILDSAHQKQLAVDVLAVVKTADARAKVIPHLCRRYAFDPYPLLVTDESEQVKLSIIRGMQMLASSYGYTLGSVDHGADTLQYVIQTDPSPKVREDAKKLLQRITGQSGGPSSPAGEPRRP